MHLNSVLGALTGLLKLLVVIESYDIQGRRYVGAQGGFSPPVGDGEPPCRGIWAFLSGIGRSKNEGISNVL